MADNNLDWQLRVATKAADDAMLRSFQYGQNLFERRGFKLNVKSSGSPLGTIGRDFTNFEKSLDAATERVVAFTSVTTLIYGVGRAFQSIISDTVGVEKSLASIQSILKASASDLSSFSDSLFRAANATGQTFDEAAKAALEFSRQGLSLNKTIEATTAALTFARISGIDAAKAVQVLTAEVNTFNAEGLDYIDIVDKITALDNNFAASAAGIAEGLKRVGSVASDTGTSFNELAAVITSVQQITARGEAVIGNGLKTIFTRLQRGGVQDQLAELGIVTKDATGEFRPLIDVLKDLAGVYQNLSDTQKANITETVGGVFQANTLRATLKALSSEYGTYARALNVVDNASGDAEARLKVLNNTTATALTQLQNNLKEFNSLLGKEAVQPILGELIKSGNNLLGGLKEGLGTDVGKAILDGIVNAIQGPGVTVIFAIIGKLFAKVVSDFSKAFSSLLNINKETIANAELQKTVNSAIAIGNEALVQRLATTKSVVEQNIILNRLLTQQNVVNNLRVSAALVKTGLAANKIPTKAGGFLPAIIAESKSISQGVGGASISASPVIKRLNLGKGLEPAVLNTSEYIVRNYAGGGTDAVFNPHMIAAAGGIENLKKFGRVEKVSNYAGGNLQGIGNQVASLFAQAAQKAAQDQYASSIKFGAPPPPPKLSTPPSIPTSFASLYAPGRPLPSITRGGGSPLVDLTRNIPDNSFGGKIKDNTGKLLLSSFAVSALGGALFGNESKGGRIGSGITSALGTGLSIASITGGNPLGLTIAALVTTFQGLDAVVKNTGRTFEDVTAESQKIVDANSKESDIIQQAIREKDNLADLISSGASPDKINKANRSLTDTLFQIGDSSVANAIRSGDAQGLRDKDSYLERLNRSTSRETLVQASAQLALANKGILNSISGFTSGGDTRKILGNDDVKKFAGTLASSIDISKITPKIIEDLDNHTIDIMDTFKKFQKQLDLTDYDLEKFNQSFFDLGTATKNSKDVEKSAKAQLIYRKAILDVSESAVQAGNSAFNLKKAFDLIINARLSAQRTSLVGRAASFDTNVGIAKTFLSANTGSINPFLNNDLNTDIAIGSSIFKGATDKREIITQSLGDFLKEHGDSFNTRDLPGVSGTLGKILSGQLGVQGIGKFLKNTLNKDQQDSFFKDLTAANIKTAEALSQIDIKINEEIRLFKESNSIEKEALEKQAQRDTLSVKGILSGSFNQNINSLRGGGSQLLSLDKEEEAIQKRIDAGIDVEKNSARLRSIRQQKARITLESNSAERAIFNLNGRGDKFAKNRRDSLFTSDANAIDILNQGAERDLIFAQLSPLIEAANRKSTGIGGSGVLAIGADTKNRLAKFINGGDLSGAANFLQNKDPNGFKGFGEIISTLRSFQDSLGASSTTRALSVAEENNLTLNPRSDSRFNRALGRIDAAVTQNSLENNLPQSVSNIEGLVQKLVDKESSLLEIIRAGGVVQEKQEALTAVLQKIADFSSPNAPVITPTEKAQIEAERVKLEREKKEAQDKKEALEKQTDTVSSINALRDSIDKFASNFNAKTESFFSTAVQVTGASEEANKLIGEELNTQIKRIVGEVIRDTTGLVAVFKPRENIPA